MQTARLLPQLWHLWQTSDNAMLRRECAWTIWTLPFFLDRDRVTLAINETSGAFLEAEDELQDLDQRGPLSGCPDNWVLHQDALDGQETNPELAQLKWAEDGVLPGR